MNALTLKAGGSHSTAAAATVAAVTIASLAAAVGVVAISRSSRPDRTARDPYIPSPLRTQIPNLTPTQIAELPYPPEGALPGGRDVETAYGSIRVYEWGPETGEKVLFVHGISTPCVALGDLGWELVRRGYRVMLFDLFGRGYSDAPLGIPYDTRLYTTQILLVLASSHLSWLSSPPPPPHPLSGQTPTSTPTSTDPPGFHLLGYSLGGCLCVAFAVQFPHLLRSLDLVASSGLIRRRHVGGGSRFLYESGLLPEWFIHGLVRRRIRPADPTPPLTAAATLKEKKKKSTGPEDEDEEVSGADILVAEVSTNQTTTPGPQDHTPTAQPHHGEGGGGGGGGGNSDATGGAAFDSARLSRDRPDVTVSSVVRWQVDEHAGFVGVFMSTIRECPIYARPKEEGGEGADWAALRDILLLHDGENGESEEDGHVSTAMTTADDDTDADVGTVIEKASSSSNTHDPKHDSATKTHAHHTPQQRGLSAKGKILVILGGKDTVIDRAETVQDITAIFNSNNRSDKPPESSVRRRRRRELVDFVVFEDAGHEVPITSSAEVASALVRHWHGE